MNTLPCNLLTTIFRYWRCASLQVKLFRHLQEDSDCLLPLCFFQCIRNYYGPTQTFQLVSFEQRGRSRPLGPYLWMLRNFQAFRVALNVLVQDSSWDFVLLVKREVSVCMQRAIVVTTLWLFHQCKVNW